MSTEALLLIVAGLALLGFLGGRWISNRVAKRREEEDANPLYDNTNTPRTTPAGTRAPVPEPQGYESFQTRLKGNLRIGGQTTLPGNVLLQGPLIVEDEAELGGHLEVFGDVTVGTRSQITEPIVIHGNLTLGPHAKIHATRVEGDIIMHQGATVQGPAHCHTLYLDDTDGNPETTAISKPPHAVTLAEET